MAHHHRIHWLPNDSEPRRRIARLAPPALIFFFMGGIAWYLSGFLVFGGRLPADYRRPVEECCGQWYTGEVFGDHRFPGDRSPVPHLRTCAEAKALPRTTAFARTREGLRVRLVFPGDDRDRGLPLWLHVHGITDNHLNGLRFYDAARRLGFRLVLVELQNHGASSRHPQGSSWGCREKWDILAALAHLSARYPRRPLLVSATSLGTMAVSQAVLEDPAAFAAVRGLIYESPLGSLNQLYARGCLRLGLGGPCAAITGTVVPAMARLRSDVDFKHCFVPAHRVTALPTLLWLSLQEIPDDAELVLARRLPQHSDVRVQVFARGSHSAYYGYQPAAIEQSIAAFWRSVSR